MKPHTNTAALRVPAGPHLGGFPVLASFRVDPAEPDVGISYPTAEIQEFYSITSPCAPLGKWFWNLLSQDQLEDLHQQCLESDSYDNREWEDRHCG